MQEWIRPRIGLGRKEALTQARRLLRRERLYHIDMPRSVVNMDADPIALFLDELEMGTLLQVRPILHIELDLLELSHDQFSFACIHFNHHHPSKPSFNLTQQGTQPQLLAIIGDIDSHTNLFPWFNLTIHLQNTRLECCLVPIEEH